MDYDLRTAWDVMLQALGDWAAKRARLTTSSLTNPEKWLSTGGGASVTKSGVSVSEETALRVTTVYACVRLIAGSVASLPLHVYRRLDRGKEIAREHWLYGLLHDEPNEEMTAYQWRESMMVAALLWGNSYTYIEFDGAGRVRALWPLTPDRVSARRNERTREVEYVVTSSSGASQVVPSWNMLHVPGLGFDGLVGRSVIGFHREVLGLAMAAEEYGTRLFGQGLLQRVALKHPGKLTPDAKERIERSFEEKSGLASSHRPLILQEGMDLSTFSISPEDAQFLETRRFQVAEICRIFGVPPHMVGDVERSTSWGAGIEAQGIGFVVYVLRPWLIRIEQAMNRMLFSAIDQRRGLFVEHAVDGLLRGDYQTRTEGYSKAISAGWMTRNEVRALENLNPLDGLDEPLRPANLLSGEAQPEDGPVPGGDGDMERYRPLLEQTWRRIYRRGKQDWPVAVKRGAEAEWRAELRKYMAEQMEPIHGLLAPPASPVELPEDLDPSSWDIEALARQAADVYLGVANGR